MDVVVVFPRTWRQNDSIWDIVDRFNKSAHFFPIKSTYTAKDYAKIYSNEIVSLHDTPLSITTDRGAQFTSCFWKAFQKVLGTQVKLRFFSSSHRCLEECTIKTLQDMLRACAIEFEGSWDDHLHLVEFSYNNNYHWSISMTPFEAFYGRRCRPLVVWFEVGESSLLSPEIIYEALEKF